MIKKISYSLLLFCHLAINAGDVKEHYPISARSPSPTQTLSLSALEKPKFSPEDYQLYCDTVNFANICLKVYAKYTQKAGDGSMVWQGQYRPEQGFYVDYHSKIPQQILTPFGQWIFAKVTNKPDAIALEPLDAIFAKQVVLTEIPAAEEIYGVISINGKLLPEPKMPFTTEPTSRHPLLLQPKQAKEAWAAMAAKYQKEMAAKKKSGLLCCFACKKKDKAGQ